MFNDIKWTKENYIKFKQYLFTKRDESYKIFNQKTVPTVNINTMIGIRIPEIRKISKDILKGDYLGYLDICDNEFFEETMIEAVIIRRN